MKKIITLFIMFIAFASGGYAQCALGTYQAANVPSNNLGLPQELTIYANSSGFVEVSNITLGSDYIFTLTADAVSKYVTVTDDTNAVIAYGVSPLTVTNLAKSTIRIHSANDATCDIDYGYTTATIQLVLSCPPASSLNVSGITTSNATFNWSAGGSETTWEVLVLNQGDPAPTATTSGTTVNTTPTYTKTDLTAANLYQFYVRAICSGSDKSPWNGPLNFASGCNTVNSFSEDFSTTNYGELPVCWSGVISPSLDSFLNNIGGTSSNSVSIYSYGDASTGNLILASPILGNLNAGTHRITFTASSSNGATLQVGTLNNTSSTATFSSIQNITLTPVPTVYKINFAGYNGTDDFIGIRNNSTAPYGEAIIDNVVWETIPACPDVSSITVPIVNQTNATVNWVTGGISSYQIARGSLTDTDPNALTKVTSTSSTRTLTGLTANTSYQVWVRTVCAGPTYGAWEGPVSFKTACAESAVLTENFNATADGELPGCWSKIVTGNSAYSGGSVGVVEPYADPATGNKVGQLNSISGASTDNLILVSPRLSNLSAGTYRLKFTAKVGFGGDLEIGTLSTQTNQAVFASLQTINVTSTTTEFKIDFAGYSGGNKYIGIRVADPTLNNSFEIDDVVWELTPLCGDVSDLNLTGLTTSTATVAWTPASGQTKWDAVIGDSTVTNPDSLTIVPVSGTPQTTFPDLSASTTYKVWVRSACGAPNGNGYWIGPFTFTTPCAAVSTFNEDFNSMTTYKAVSGCWSAIISGPGVDANASVQVSGGGVEDTNSIIINTNTAGPLGNDDKVILVSPTVNLAGRKIKFLAKSDTPIEAIFEVGTLNSNLSNATFTALPVSPIALTTDYVEYTVDLSAYVGTDTYIGFRNKGGYSVYVDNIRLEESTLSTPNFATLDNINAVAYPNPFTNDFSIDLTSMSQDTIQINVYDMVGRLVEHKQGSLNDLARTKIGNNYQVGIYNIVVNQGENTKTIRVIKK